MNFRSKLYFTLVIMCVGIIGLVLARLSDDYSNRANIERTK
jgi:hypothetical protein